MGNTAFFDEFLGHNLTLSNHDDIASSDDTNDDDPMLGTQCVDYTPLEHVHENRGNPGQGNVRRRLCSEPSLGSCQ